MRVITNFLDSCDDFVLETDLQITRVKGVRFIHRSVHFLYWTCSFRIQK